MQIQTGRLLGDVEVNEINYIIKRRARRFVAAAKEEWLFPERKILNQNWRKFGGGYLLMPDPRSVTFTTKMFVGYEGGSATAFDEYGRTPGHPEFDNQRQADREWKTFHEFQGEFARLNGPSRRGLAFEFGRLDHQVDDDDYHQYHLSLEGERTKPQRRKRSR